MPSSPKENIWLKKRLGTSALNRTWVEPDVRNNVVETMQEYTERTEIAPKRLLRYSGLSHIFTSVGYPHNNGKIERFFRTAKPSYIRRQSFLSI